MKCKDIQDFIITDYIDGQLVDQQERLINQHLLHCHECKGFLISVQKETVDPFINASKVFPDKLLWTRIKQTIAEQEEQKLMESLSPGFWERLKDAVHIPRPAFALASIVTMIFMIGATGQLFLSAPVVKFNGPDQVEYLSSLIDEPVDISSNNSNDLKTPIEQYFL